MQLSDFFHPLNAQTLLLFAVIIGASDAIGFFIARLLKLPLILRFAEWMIGLGFFVFLWFVLHFFIPFDPRYVSLSLFILGVSVLPFYVKNKGPVSLCKEIIGFPWPFIFFLLVAKPLFFMNSLPPYMWDEMAYHYYSPARLVAETHWQYGSSISTGNHFFDFFSLMPRFLDTAYVLFFAITKTYSTARLFHTFLYFTSVFLMGRFLQKKLSLIAGIIFAFLGLFFNLTLLRGATLGYTDSGTAALLLIYLVCTFGFILERQKNYLRSMVIFAAMSMGSKYTSFVFILSSLLTVGGIEIFLQKEQLLRIFKKRTFKKVKISPLLLEGVLLLIFFLTGNPIYPFVFPCWKGISCGTGGAYFSSWTLGLNPGNFFQILNILFQAEAALYILVVIALILMGSLFWVFRRKDITLITVLLFFSILIEVLISHKISGFELRYFSHWLIIIPLVYVLPLGYLKKELIQKMTVRKTLTLAVLSLFTLILLIKTLPGSIESIKGYHELRGITDNDRWFARGKMSFVDWLHPTTPHLYPLILWCGEAKKPVDIYTADPKLIYWTESLSKIFLVNCNLHYIKDIFALPPEEVPAATKKYMKDHPDQIYVSSLTCEETKDAIQTAPYIMKDPFMNRFIYIHQEIICQSKEVGPRRYEYLPQ
jgi:hypothetical protein